MLHVIERKNVLTAMKKLEGDIASLYAAVLAWKKHREQGEKCPLDFSDNMTHKDLAYILNGLHNWNWTCPACGQEFEE